MLDRHTLQCRDRLIGRKQRENAHLLVCLASRVRDFCGLLFFFPHPLGLSRLRIVTIRTDLIVSHIGLVAHGTAHIAPGFATLWARRRLMYGTMVLATHILQRLGRENFLQVSRRGFVGLGGVFRDCGGVPNTRGEESGDGRARSRDLNGGFKSSWLRAPEMP